MVNKNDWNFEDNVLWENDFPTCSTLSNEQSPINIESSDVTECNLLCKAEFTNSASECNLKYENNMVKMSYGTGSYLNFSGRNYTLKKNDSLRRPAISIHIPSLHTIDNERFDMEIIMIYASESEGNRNTQDNGVIVSRFANKKGGDYGKLEDFFNQFINNIPYDTTDYYVNVPVSDDWGVSYLEPTVKSFYTYKGSLPYPPCTENYTWVLFTEVENIGETNYKILKDNIGSNIRPLQRLNNRKISYNPGEQVDIAKTLETQKFSEDKFLRCEKKPYPTPTTQVVPTTQTDETGFSQKTLHNIKSILLLLTVIIMMIFAFLMVKYLYKQFYVQIWIKNLAGSQHITDDVWEEWKNTRKIFKSIKPSKNNINTNNNLNISNVV